jgi:DNA ligase (NAD+)
MADSLINYFSNEQNIKNIDRCLGMGVVFSETTKTTESIITDKTFVFTGNLKQFSRREAINLIEKFGGKNSSSISIKTNYIVAGPSAGKKLDKAKKLNLPILDENEFIKLMNEIG